MAKHQTTYTLEDFVESGDNDNVKYSALSMSEKAGNIIFPILNVIDDYLDELIDASEIVDLTEDQKFKYKYRPKLLCEHLYGNGELYYIILLINGICNMKEFILTSTTRLIPKDKLLSIIKQIYKAERDQITMYNEKQEDS